ncbi:MAG: SIMPL domain-containing protein [Candidatus Gastranaerophilaceae bacterium]
MRKVLLTAAVLGLLIGSASLSSQAVTTAVERGYISVNTTANTELAPDVAEVSIAVQTTDAKSMQKATLQNKEISDKVISALKSMINTADGDYIKTSDFNASPIYSYSGSRRTLDKYQVSNSIIIHTKSIEKVGAMIDKAIALGATNVDSLAFSVSNYENQCNDLLSIATKKAQNRANSIAKTASTTVTGIRSLDVSCSANNAYRPQYRMMMAKNMDAAGAEASTSIEKGGKVR